MEINMQRQGSDCVAHRSRIVRRDRAAPNQRRQTSERARTQENAPALDETRRVEHFGRSRSVRHVFGLLLLPVRYIALLVK